MFDNILYSYISYQFTILPFLFIKLSCIWKKKRKKKNLFQLDIQLFADLYVVSRLHEMLIHDPFVSFLAGKLGLIPICRTCLGNLESMTVCSGRNIQ